VDVPLYLNIKKKILAETSDAQEEIQYHFQMKSLHELTRIYGFLISYLFIWGEGETIDNGNLIVLDNRPIKLINKNIIDPRVFNFDFILSNFSVTSVDDLRMRLICWCLQKPGAAHPS
jgi:hypothetical protein